MYQAFQEAQPALYNQLVLSSHKALSYLRFIGTVPEEEF